MDPVCICEGKHLRLSKRGHWEYAERTRASGAAVIIAITDEGSLILTEQFRPPVDRCVIELPAGLVGDIEGQEFEELAEAAKRELLEETGYQARSLKHLFTGPSSAGLTSELISIFHATGLTRVSNGGGVEGESIVLHEVPVAEVDIWIESRMSQGLLVDPKVFSALWMIRKTIAAADYVAR